MREKYYAVALVYSTSNAIKIERMLNLEGVETKLMPVPRHLSSDCGVCVRFRIDDLDKVREIFSKSTCEFEGIYPLVSVENA